MQLSIVGADRQARTMDLREGFYPYPDNLEKHFLIAQCLMGYERIKLGDQVHLVDFGDSRVERHYDESLSALVTDNAMLEPVTHIDHHTFWRTDYSRNVGAAMEALDALTTHSVSGYGYSVLTNSAFQDRRDVTVDIWDTNSPRKVKSWMKETPNEVARGRKRYMVALAIVDALCKVLSGDPRFKPYPHLH